MPAQISPIGDTLTIFEAAMVYADRHPNGAYLRDGDVDHYEQFMGKPRLESDPNAQLSWVIYRLLLREIDAGQIALLKTSYLNGGERIDPRHSRIATQIIVDLARQRGDAGKYISLLVDAAGEPVTVKEVRPAESSSGQYNREIAKIGLAIKSGGAKGGKLSGQARRNKAETTWKPHALELAKSVRLNKPHLSQEKLAAEIEFAWKLELEHLPNTTHADEADFPMGKHRKTETA